MRTSLPLFTKLILTCCCVLLAGSSAFASGPTAAGFTQAPDHVAVSPEGCNSNGGVTLQNNGGTFICTPDTVPPSDAPYTSGNLGKNWAELDFVPFKLTTSRSLGSTTPTYNVIIAGDYQQGGTTGYDFITIPILDPNLPSDNSCTVADANGGVLEVATGVTGGTNTTVYRTLTISQAAGTTCYFAYDQRLAIGSHLFNGSNLQAYTFLGADFKTGKQTIPIPVNPCNSNNPGCQPSPQPQSIDKTMTATAGQSINWALNGSGPANITADTCDTNQLTKSKLKFTISWSAVSTASGGVTIVTKVFATNPAAVPVQVQITDKIYPGTDATQDNDPFIVPPGPNSALDTATGSFVTVPANTQNQLVLTHTYNDPSGSAGTGYNDIAVGSYEDADGNQVPGNTFAQASATATSGSATNTTATVNNQESISPTSLNFSTDSVTPSDASVSGSFAGGYSLGTEIPLNFNQPLSWTSNTQDASTVETLGGAGVTFGKSVYLPFATAVSGTLTDSATLTDSGSNTVDMSPSLTVNVTGAPQVSLEIDKTINVAVGTDQTFTFEVTDSHNNSTPASITIKAGMTSGNTTVTGLTPDKYTVTEDANPLWTNDGPHSIDLSPDPSTGAVTCTGSKVTFVNTIVNQDLTVSKTATPAFTRTYTWGITKAVDKTTIDTNGAGATFNYTVDVTHDNGTDSAWQVTGKITVTNPNSDDFTGVNVTDAIDDGGTCTVTNGTNVTVSAGSSVQLDYKCTYASAPSPSSFTNTATATWDSSFGTPHTSGTGTATADFSTTTPTLVDDSVTVTDTFGGTLGTVFYTDASPKEFKYSHTFNNDPAGTCTDHNNTATFTTDTTKTTGNDSKKVTVCVGADLTVSKTATPAIPAYKWTITKAVSPNGTVESSSAVTLNYTVTTSFTKTGGWSISGTITVSNPNDWEAITGVTVTDALDAGSNGTCVVTGGTNVTVAKSGSVQLPYTCSYTTTPSPTSGTNTATATWTAATFFTPHGSATGTSPYTFPSPITNGPTSITVTDAFNGGAAITLGTVNALTNTTTPNTNPATDGGLTITSPSFGVFKYSRKITPTQGKCTTYNNTATIVETNQSASASVTICGTNTGALTMGFWQNKNGQGIITGGASTAGVCNSGTWLRQYAPFQDLSSTATCAQVASYVYNVIKAANASGSSMNAMLKAQMLATALDVYFSDPALGGNKIGAPAPIGGIKIDLTKVCSMIDSSSGTGTCSGTYLNASAAFGGATSGTVSFLLAYAASQSNAGGTTWYGQNKTIQGLAKNTFDSINNQAATIAP